MSNNIPKSTKSYSGAMKVAYCPQPTPHFLLGIAPTSTINYRSATRRRTVAWLAFSSAFGLAGAADSPPTSPERTLLKVVVPVPPGGAADTMARLVMAPVSESLHMSLVIDNRPGASTQVGAEFVVRSRPDGRTLLFTTDATTVINPHLYDKMRYAPKDLIPITLVGITPFILVCSGAFPATSLQQLLEVARAQPATVSYASIGVGSPQHLCMEMFARRAGVTFNHIPYSGAASLTAVAGGQVDITFASLGGAAPHVRSGKFRALGVATPARVPMFPDVPTFAESGWAGYTAGTWLGLFGPAGMSAADVRRMQEAVSTVLQVTSVRDSLAAIGADPVGNTPAQFAALIARESAQWGSLIRSARIRVE